MSKGDVMKFAFYGRCSTEDMQDPASSKQWQMARAKGVLPADGVIVAEYFDVGMSRSLPWRRRPEASALLSALKDPDRGWEAITIGEPARAFHGAQFQDIFPVLTGYGVQLWVPDAGGYVDPDSDGAEMMMAIYGTMSAQERRRIKIRVRSAMQEQAKHEGRYLGGRPPYGLRLADAGPHPSPAKTRTVSGSASSNPTRPPLPLCRGSSMSTSPERGTTQITTGLTRDGIPSPSAHDPARNRHRDVRSWSKIAVKSILNNPKYTGRTVWNRQRRDEELLDRDDATQGYQSRMRWNDPSEWIWSAEQTHEAIVDSETFASAQAQMAAGSHRPNSGKTKTTGRTYVLSGRVHCGLCGHRMQGNPNHGENHYRCRYPRDFRPGARHGSPAHRLRPRVGHRAQARRVDRLPVRSREPRRDLPKAG